jgi:hypothetical protein
VRSWGKCGDVDGERITTKETLNKRNGTNFTASLFLYVDFLLIFGLF